MAGSKLDLLYLETQKYLGLPYFSNLGRHQTSSSNNADVGKGSAKEIALRTIEIANLENIKLVNLSPIQIYNFQKKHRLGIDCSGLVCHLLNFYFSLSLNPRKTSANKLTSLPLSTTIKLGDIRTGDLIRQKNGRHVLFVINRLGDTVSYTDSRKDSRGVKTDSFSLSKPDIEIGGVFRLTSLLSIPDISTD
ncbi:MAG: hypothetical protein AAB574_01855 [Patescibacteria group bacterium]